MQRVDVSIAEEEEQEEEEQKEEEEQENEQEEEENVTVIHSRRRPALAFTNTVLAVVIYRVDAPQPEHTSIAWVLYGLGLQIFG